MRGRVRARGARRRPKSRSRRDGAAVELLDGNDAEVADTIREPEPGMFLLPEANAAFTACNADDFVSRDWLDQDLTLVDADDARFSFKLEVRDSFDDRDNEDAGDLNKCLMRALYDCNGDGIDDFVCNQGYGETSLIIFRTRDNGHFTVSVENNKLRSSRGIGIADFDGDGRMDVATAISNAVFYGNRDNSCDVNRFDRVGTPSQNNELLSIMDVNGDGELDYVDADSGQFWHEQTGNRQFTLINDFPGVGRTYGPNEEGAYTADMNGDTQPDIVLTSNANTYVYFSNVADDGAVTYSYRGTNPWTGWGAIDATGEETEFLFNDCDLDGDLDLYVKRNGRTNAVQLAINDGTGEMTRVHTNGPFPSDPESADFVDVDGDGWQDLVVVNDRFRIFRNTGQCVFREMSFRDALDYNGDRVWALDYDRDGDMDLVTNLGVHRNRLAERGLLDARTALEISVRGVGRMRTPVGAHIRVFDAANDTLVGHQHLGSYGHLTPSYRKRFYVARGGLFNVRVTFPLSPPHWFLGVRANGAITERTLLQTETDFAADPAVAFSYTGPSTELADAGTPAAVVEGSTLALSAVLGARLSLVWSDDDQIGGDELRWRFEIGTANATSRALLDGGGAPVEPFVEFSESLAGGVAAALARVRLQHATTDGNIELRVGVRDVFPAELVPSEAADHVDNDAVDRFEYTTVRIEATAALATLPPSPASPTPMPTPADTATGTASVSAGTGATVDGDDQGDAPSGGAPTADDVMGSGEPILVPPSPSPSADELPLWVFIAAGVGGCLCCAALVALLLCVMAKRSSDADEYAEQAAATFESTRVASPKAAVGNDHELNTLPATGELHVGMYGAASDLMRSASFETAEFGDGGYFGADEAPGGAAPTVGEYLAFNADEANAKSIYESGFNEVAGSVAVTYDATLDAEAMQSAQQAAMAKHGDGGVEYEAWTGPL